MRLDHFNYYTSLELFFEIDLKYTFSLFPSALIFKNIFCGMFPSDMVKNYPNQAHDMESEASSLNQHENFFT